MLFSSLLHPLRCKSIEVPCPSFPWSFRKYEGNLKNTKDFSCLANPQKPWEISRKHSKIPTNFTARRTSRKQKHQKKEGQGRVKSVTRYTPQSEIAATNFHNLGGSLDEELGEMFWPLSCFICCAECPTKVSPQTPPNLLLHVLYIKYLISYLHELLELEGHKRVRFQEAQLKAGYREQWPLCVMCSAASLRIVN